MSHRLSYREKQLITEYKGQMKVKTKSKVLQTDRSWKYLLWTAVKPHKIIEGGNDYLPSKGVYRGL